VDPKLDTVERKLARIADSAHGVVTRAEALRAGITVDELKHRVRTGALFRVHRGVYRVGHRAPCYEARYLAAVKACDEGAALSGPAAAHLHGLVRGPAPAPEVTSRTTRQVRGVRTRRSPLRPQDRMRARGIPVTTVPRTLVDIAAVLSLDDLSRACHEASVRYGTTPAHVEAVLARRPVAPGSKRLRAILHGEEPIVLSKLERRVFDLLRDAGLDLPETNRVVDGRVVDCRWPRHKLTVELDSYRFHRSRFAWERDRRREREARARGDDFRRFTYDDAFERPETLLAEMRPILAPRRRRGS
jgi:very-short-patch-repair endonuclease